MSQRCTIRLPHDLRMRLQMVADAQGTVASDVIRQALASFLDGQNSGNNASPLRADESIPPSHDCACKILALLPGEVRTLIQEKASFLNLTLDKLIAALVTSTVWPLGRSTPQV